MGFVMGEAVKKVEVINVISEEVISRKTILETYIKADPEEIEDPVIHEFVVDRKKARDTLKAYSDELKMYMDKLQQKAAKLHGDITEQNARMKYIDDKIVERHIKITGLGK